MRALIDIFAQVFRSIGANKLRSFLTMFGIAWGVASLLLLIGLGEGFRSGQRRSLSELGTDVIMLFGGTVPASPGQHTGMRPYKLTLGDAVAIRTQASHVRNATAFINRGDLKEVSEFSSAGGPVMGVGGELSGDTAPADRAGTVSECGRHCATASGGGAGAEEQSTAVSGAAFAGGIYHAERVSVSGDWGGSEDWPGEQ